MHGLTQSYVINGSQILPLLLHHKELVSEQNSPHYLLIYSTNPLFTKISVYPVNELPVMKYIIGGPQVTPNTIEEMLLLLKKINPIILHTSGIVFTDTQYEYEIYFTGVGDINISSFKHKITQIQGIEFIEVAEVNYVR